MEAAAKAEINMDDDEIIGTTLPHSSFGDPDCSGCLNGITCGHQAVITCKECGKVVRFVPAAELELILDRMELALEVASAICPHSGAAHLEPGFSELLVFVCDECGEAVEL